MCGRIIRREENLPNFANKNICLNDLPFLPLIGIYLYFPHTEDWNGHFCPLGKSIATEQSSHQVIPKSIGFSNPTYIWLISAHAPFPIQSLFSEKPTPNPFISEQKAI